MRIVKFVFLAIVFVSSCTNVSDDICAYDKYQSITELLSIDSVEKIVFIKDGGPPPIRGEFEEQTPLYIDSVKYKWTDNRERIQTFLRDLPKIVLDSMPEVIETGCCVGHMTYLFFSKEKVTRIGFDKVNKNLLYVQGGGFLKLNSNSLESLQKYLDRKVLVQEIVITKSADTSDLDIINRELSSRGSIFVGNVDKETITKFQLK